MRVIKSLPRGNADGEPVKFTSATGRYWLPQGHKEIGDTIQGRHRVVILCLAQRPPRSSVTYKKAGRLPESDNGLQRAE